MRGGGNEALRPAGKLKHAPPFFMKFLGPKAHSNRPQKAMVCPTCSSGVLFCRIRLSPRNVETPDVGEDADVAAYKAAPRRQHDDCPTAKPARFTAMGIRKSVFSLLLLCPAGMCAADAGLDSAIAKNRMGTLVILAAPGAKVSVEQVRHEFWFGATLPGGAFSGRTSPEDIAKWKEIFTSHFNAGVPEADFKWDVMERQKGQVNYGVVDNMLAWAAKEGITLRGHRSESRR